MWEFLYQLLREQMPRLLAPRHLHPADMEKVLRARVLLLASLAVVPRLPQLAAGVGLRVSVLQTLFRQLFASSIVLSAGPDAGSAAAVANLVRQQGWV